jgi:signal transduction histidine kinase
MMKELEDAINIKTQFVSQMSHELRTPLNAISGFSDLLLNSNYSNLNEEQVEYIQDISKSVDHLCELVDNILLLRFLNREEFEESPISLSGFLEEVESLFRYHIKQKGLYLVTAIKRISEDFFYTMPILLKQVLINLIGNTIKFTEEGGVEVRVTPHNGDFYLFSIKETGVGISPHEGRDIFTPL